jgi:hypothetical protein
MRDDGVFLEALPGELRLVTTDPAIAQKYGMHDESEILHDRPNPEPPDVSPKEI